ncbi:inositol-pentakisphosphate 2-kinase [Phascolomyces articulosus]|uniref:Inositol-pentakisphosphate 2-kinase n=1 Tax=Phascolomyces articulosus TaxID=60185 RepID=A0AAD5KAK3_9FUNG|nr:inositol-pentakisphosphate 2-kinase [Phascolomyces articulosus]
MDPNHWSFLAEGNQNIVLKYIGQDSSYLGHVLRVQKDKSTDARFHPSFTKEIIGNLLGHEYVVPLTCVPVSFNFLKILETNITQDRPDHRRARTIDLHQLFVCLAPDLTFRSLVTVEIKPKWGFKPDSLFIQDKHQSLKASQCRFCMHTFYKHDRHDMDYCPLDLYSMDLPRMRRALNALERESLHDKMRIMQNHTNNNALANTSTLLNLVAHILYQESLLPRLKKLQKELDQLNIEGIFPIYNKLVQQQTSFPLYDMDRWRKVIHCFHERKKSTLSLSDEMDSNLELQYIYEHVLSAILKDCSIFITIMKDDDRSSSIGNNKKTIQLEDGIHYTYMIKVVDTDIKKISKIPSWYDLDQRIMEHVLQHENPKVCHD